MLIRLFFTLRNLKPEQFFYRFYYRFFKFLVRRVSLKPLPDLCMREWHDIWISPLFGQSPVRALGVFEFLGEVGVVKTTEDWNSPKKSKLWLYNLHYFDCLNSPGADDKADVNLFLLRSWVRCNPPLFGNGWEPYPLALRIVNVVKWLARHDHFKEEFREILARHAQALLAQEERHLLANHLFVDAKGLVFAGAFFKGEDADIWLARGLAILDIEVDRQFLSDGGNYELSPMYHSSLLWDVCDLIRLAQVTGIPSLIYRVDKWRSVVEKGVRWLRLMCHPDGNISFFNDASFGIAPSLSDLVAYSEDVGCCCGRDGSALDFVTHLFSSGYVVLNWGPSVCAILDVGEIGPSYQPGHAHADTLSFELSVFGERVLVNSGTSQYGHDAERQRQRSTMAHNTVTLNGMNSSDVWAGFRVGRRASPFGLSISSLGDVAEVVCSHDGYRRLFKNTIHTRKWIAMPGGLRIVDSVSGPFDSAIIRMHLHPDVVVTELGVLVLKSGRSIRFVVEGGEWSVQQSTWHPRFGVRLVNSCIEIRAVAREISVQMFWG